MTRQLWEYLYVTHTYETKWRYHTREKDFGPPERDRVQKWAHVYKIARPDAEVETLEWERPNWAKLLCQFGGEGWELVSEQVTDTTIVETSGGWKEVAVPVRTAWTFKRPSASD